MKRFTLVIVAMLFGIFAFAQLETIKIPAINDQERSGWVGNTGIESLFPVSAGIEYAIAPKAISSDMSGTITKVKFYSDATNYAAYGVTNNSYTIKIYEGSVDLSAGYADYATSGLTQVYTQDYTATVDGYQEVELTTAYTITSANFYVSIVSNGAGALFMGGNDANSLGQYMMSYDNEGTIIWIANEFTDNNNNPTTNSFTLAVYNEDGQAYQASSDLSAIFMASGSAPYNVAPSTMTLTADQSLVIYPITQNNGPDAATANINYSITINGEAYFENVLELTEEDALNNGYFTWLYAYASEDDPETYLFDMTVTADVLNTMNLPTNFDVCLEVSYEGTDNNTANNRTCIAVTRETGSGGGATQEGSDIAVAFQEYTNGETVNLPMSDNFVVTPLLTNNGPEATSNTITISVTINEQELTGGTVDASGANALPSGQTVTIMQGGTLTLTKEQLDMIGANSFEICLSATYAGTDPVLTNNSVCVLVVRNDATAIDENIASEISVYPNPANDIFTVANAEGATIMVVNSLGQVVASIENADANQTIDVSNFANGTYFVKVNETVVKINVVK